MIRIRYKGRERILDSQTETSLSSPQYKAAYDFCTNSILILDCHDLEYMKWKNDSRNSGEQVPRDFLMHIELEYSTGNEIKDFLCALDLRNKAIVELCNLISQNQEISEQIQNLLKSKSDNHRKIIRRPGAL